MLPENETKLRENERKFLVTSEAFMDLASSVHYINQGYLNSDPNRTVRIRIQDDQGIMTIKGIGDAKGFSRFEWEQNIDLADAKALFALAEPSPIEKQRYRVLIGKHWWDVDVFLGTNAGLILAEIELTHWEDEFERPEWIDQEVTGDPRFYNSSLSKRPYSTWTDK